MTERDIPLKFTISNDEPLPKPLIECALSMAASGMERAALDMDGTVTMTFEPDKISFEYHPSKADAEAC